jgi:hypothetical protein
MEIAKGCNKDLTKLLLQITMDCSPWTGELRTLKEKQAEWEAQDGPLKKHHLYFAPLKVIQKKHTKKEKKEFTMLQITKT